MNRFLVLALLVGIADSAGAQVPCSGLTGQARTNCLNVVQQQTQQRVQQQAAQQAQQQAQQSAGTATGAQLHTSNPPLTQAQRQATAQGIQKGNEAAIQSSKESVDAYNNAYNAAKVGDTVLRNAAGEVKPFGSAAYGLGDYIVNHPVTVQKNVPPLPKYGYTPPPVPIQTCKNFPSLPNCGPTRLP